MKSWDRELYFDHRVGYASSHICWPKLSVNTDLDFSKRSISWGLWVFWPSLQNRKYASFAHLKSPQKDLDDGDYTPSPAPNHSTTNHQTSTIQRLHTFDNTLIYHYREFSVLSAVCVPSSQRRHHTIKIVHIHRTSSVLLGTMMAIWALPGRRNNREHPWTNGRGSTLAICTFL